MGGVGVSFIRGSLKAEAPIKDKGEVVISLKEKSGLMLLLHFNAVQT